jgi:hypothetical protein
VTLEVAFSEAGGYLRSRRNLGSAGSSLLFAFNGMGALDGEAAFLWPSWLAPSIPVVPASRARVRTNLSARRRN